ncbi:MAG: DUF1236 domain-containing protein [Pseudolabrys sp.]
MKHGKLLAGITAALLLSAGAISAQDIKNDKAPAPAPAAQQKAPAEKVAPPMHAGDKNAQTHQTPQTTGQAPKEPEMKPSAKDDKAPAHSQNVNPKADPAKAEIKAGADVKANSTAHDDKAGNKSNTKVDVKSDTSKSGQADVKSDSKSTTTGQGAAAGSAKLSTEQRTKITTIFHQHKVAPVKLNISVSVGTRVPDHVRFYPIPQEVIVIYPEWRGYDYIYVGDQIVVVDPRTHEIVAILEA